MWGKKGKRADQGILFLKCIYLKLRVSFTVTIFALDVFHVHRNSTVTFVSLWSVSVTF